MILRQRAPRLVRDILFPPKRFQSTKQRQFSTTASAMVEASEISSSEGSDREELLKQTTDLIDNGHWHLSNNGKGLERTFKFKTFNKTWAFMNQVAEECKVQKHHPEWTNIYNRCHVRWTTHSPEGLSMRDVGMARFCDRVAGEKGEVVEEDAGANGGMGAGGEGSGGDGKFVADARECCGGKQ